MKEKTILAKVRALVKRPDYRPLNKSEFARELRISSKERVHLRAALSLLIEKGELEMGKKARFYKPKGGSAGEELVEGTLQFLHSEKRRSGYFIPDRPEKVKALRKSGEDRIYVGRRGAGTGMNGDRVLARIVRKGPPKWHKHAKSKREKYDPDMVQVEAKVEKILERGVTKIVGTFHRRGKSSAFISPEDNRLPPSFFLKEVLPKAKPGDMVVAEFMIWSNPERPPAAKMVEILGKPDAPGVDMLTVIHKHSLPLEFPPDVLAEAEAIDEHIHEDIIARREDWRDREVFTIDPEDARDFDDAISVVELPDDKGWELAVHIADVSHYVKPGSAIDREARKRGNSTYLADRVIPMIPEKLSNGVCSLNPHVERLTHAAVIHFDKEGSMQKARFVSAVIKSCRRYTYEEALTRLKLSEKAAADFDDPHERSVVAHMRRAWKLAELLRERRYQAGCFDMDFPEVRVVLDELGIAFGVKKTEHDESHQLIEEFMLAANEAVARETRNAKAPSIYRIHEDPDPGKLEDFAELAFTFGHKLSDSMNRQQIQKLTKKIKGKPEEQSLKLALLKSMKRAAYSKDPVGHFGLAKIDYCHFTSPIRRYADLIVHRSLKKLMSQRKEPTAPERADKSPNEAGAAEIASHISRTERVSADAERDSQQLKMIEYLESLLEKDANQTFTAMVTEVRPIGIFIELEELMTRGMIRKVDLPSSQVFFYDRGINKFKSALSKKGKTIGLADRVTVKLVRIDKSRGFLDFTLV